MRKFQWWMRLVGLFYLLLGVQNMPPLVRARLPLTYEGLTATLESVAVQAIVDLWFMFGTEMIVVGAMLLLASRAPLQNEILIQTILALELIRGIFVDAVWLTRGYYPAAFYIGFIVVHTVIIGTGYYFLRAARSEVKLATASA